MIRAGGASHKARQGCPVCNKPLVECHCPKVPANLCPHCHCSPRACLCRKPEPKA